MNDFWILFCISVITAAPAKLVIAPLLKAYEATKLFWDTFEIGGRA